MFETPYLREMEALYREGSDPAHDILNDDTSNEWWDRFHAVSKLGLRLLEGTKLDKQKLTEANHLLLFAMTLPGFPDGQIYTCENPDFRVITPQRKIGIELRDVYVEVPGKRPLQEQEVLRDKIVARAHELYNQTSGPAVCIDFEFLRHTDFRESDVQRIAEQLVAMIPPGLAESTEAKFVEAYNANGPWPEALAWAHGHAPHPWQVDNPRWETSRGGSVYSSEDFLQSALVRKEKRLADYRASGCDDFWLLLVVPRLAPSSFMEAPDADHVFSSSFDRGFFFQLHEAKITEMNVQKPPYAAV